MERATTSNESLDHELSQQKSQFKFLQEKVLKAEKRADEAKQELFTEREAWEARQAQQIELEKTRQKEESSMTPESLYQQIRTESPVTSGRKRNSSNAGRASPHNSKHLQGLAITGSSIVPGERPLSRRSSTQAVHSHADPRPPSHQDSIPFNVQPFVNGAILETPSIQIDNLDDFFDSVHTPATPERAINDMISVSTAAAGPSVQLVERMSAAVRRLESEKASHKDELARLLTQRDEAMEQVVGLMKEAEEKRAADEKAKKLEKDVEELNGRYLTILEMLGEKSERVEELKADVADLKQMYRELVDSTMR